MGRGVFLVTALALAASTAAQRAPFFATVVDGRGRPIAGAEVTCAFTPDMVVAGEADIVTGTTDERGRARLALLAGRLYTAWALGPPDGDGLRQVTGPTQLISTGRVVELRACDAVGQREVLIVGLGPWREAGAASLQWFPHGLHDVRHDLALPEGDTVVLPPGPWAIGSLCVSDESGATLVAARVEPLVTELPELAPPIEITANVRDPDGEPVAGAHIEHLVNRQAWQHELLASGFRGGLRHFRVAATTGEDGSARFFVPKPPEHMIGGRVHVSKLVLQATRPGFSRAARAIQAGGQLDFVIEAQPPVEVRVLGDDPPVELEAVTRYAADGVFAQRIVEGVPKGDRKWQVAAGHGGLAPRFAPHGSPPSVVVAEYVESPPAELKIDLDELGKVEVRVVGPKGGPTAAAVAIADAGRGSPIYWHGVLATDIAGRAIFRIRAGEHYVYASTGTAHALELVDHESVQPLTLALEPIATMRVRVTDADGKPVRGAAIRGTESSYHSPSVTPRDQQLDRVVSNLWWGYATIGHTDPDGVLSVLAPLRPGLTATVKLVAGARESPPFPLEPGGSAELILGR